MTSIYDQHSAAFARVSAYVVMDGAERVATVAFKFPQDGAGRLYAYVHWIGLEMVRGHANGYGYDKKSAAAYSAAGKLSKEQPAHWTDRDRARFADFQRKLMQDNGYDWARNLEDAGFVVLQAV